MSSSSSSPGDSGSASGAESAAGGAVSAILEVADLTFPMPAMDPWLFAVYHKDDYPAGNPKMEAPRVGNGADFNPRAPYRMYHGTKIPGFPQHPHRGFETLTCTLDGIIDHADSMGNAARYGKGDLQWLTAGKGIVHGEMFPLLNQDAAEGNPTKFFQIWLNLPARSKMAEPAFLMHWGRNVPRFRTADGLGVVTLWAGEVAEPQPRKALAPPKDSYATDPSAEVAALFMHLKPGARYALPVSTSDAVNRALYIVEGSALAVNGVEVRRKAMITVRANVATVLNVPADASEPTEVLLLQGRPIGEPVAQHGPFVMNTQQEIRQAFADYRRTQFGGWPWPDDDQVWPIHDSRFAKQAGQREEAPPPLGELDLTVRGKKPVDAEAGTTASGAADGGGSAPRSVAGPGKEDL